jgi:hypothetical protein
MHMSISIRFFHPLPILLLLIDSGGCFAAGAPNPSPQQRPRGSYDSCTNEAQHAAAQAAQSQQARCGFTGSRWDPNIATHVRYCRSSGVPAVQAENRAREAGLQRCSWCNDFANQAVRAYRETHTPEHQALLQAYREEQARSRVLIRGCPEGPPEGPSHGDFERHKAWCMSVNQQVSKEALRVWTTWSFCLGVFKKQQKERGGPRPGCGAVFPGYMPEPADNPPRTCMEFANRAVAQVRAKEAANTPWGKTGRWDPNGQSHLNWCNSVGIQAASQETRARDTDLWRWNITQYTRQNRAAFCQAYAQCQHEQGVENRDRKCGHPMYGRWDLNERFGYDWCMGTAIQYWEPFAARSEARERERLLQICRQR